MDFTKREIVDLKHTIAEFMVPRLKAFKETTISKPMQFKTMDDWRSIIDQMIFSFENYDNDDLDDAGWDKVEKGLDLFRECYFDLWS